MKKHFHFIGRFFGLLLFLIMSSVCQGRMKIISFIEDEEVIEKTLYWPWSRRRGRSSVRDRMIQ